MKILARLAFAVLTAGLVALYCLAMEGRVEPLQHQPTRFVTLPLTTITAAVAVFIYPLLEHLRLRLPRALALYCGFVLICALYGIYLWILFPDGSIFSISVAIIGGHLYGWPVFLAALVVQALWPWRP